MPLYKRKPFPLLEPPQDLDPNVLVFQVRFTKEVFRDYQEYLNRLNLYRRRIWTCKVTGKTNLTYEEALVSEHRATEKVQQFPKELMAPVLHMIQYSTVSLKDLVDLIHQKLRENRSVGMELHGKKEQSLCLCRVLRILEDGKYEIGWLDKDRKVTETSTVSAEDLIHKKPPVSRTMLKAFVRESTSGSAPWVVHENLAKKHSVLTELPGELRGKLIVQNGHVSKIKERKQMHKKDVLEAQDLKTNKKRRKIDNEDMAGLEIIKKKAKKDEEKQREEMIKYPINDLLVKPAADDPIFTNRPSPSTDFRVPMDCVGDLLMVWNFCSSFSRLLNLWPFSLEDFENAICHKDSGLVLIAESHSAILRLLIKDKGDYFMAIRNKKQKSKITLTNWAEYLCDFLVMEDRVEFTSHLPTIKRGHYGLLDTRIKLSIFWELISEALNTDAIRDKLNECIEQQQALAAARREEARKKREEHHLNDECDTKEMNQEHTGNNTGCLHDEDNILGNGERKHDVGSPKDVSKKSKRVSESHVGEQNLSGIESLKGQKRGKVKETQERKAEEGRKEHLDSQMEKLSIRTNPLGKDRNYNRYWFFRREGRLFVESSDSKQWGYYTSKEELDALIGSLNPKGERERALKKQLEKYYHRISVVLQKRSKDIAHKILLEEAVLRRSTRVRAQPRYSQATAFLRYVNKWKEN